MKSSETGLIGMALSWGDFLDRLIQMRSRPVIELWLFLLYGDLTF